MMNIEPYIRTTQYYETDQMGIIHHASYIYWMEEARVDFMEKIGFGYEKAVERGVDFALTGISCKYKAMSKFHEKIRIVVSLKTLTPVRMTVHYKMFGKDNTLRFCADSEHCYYSSIKKRPIALNKEIPDLYARLLSFTGPEPSDHCESINSVR